VLLTDGLPAYDAYSKAKPEVTLAQCWAHTRRYFDRAEAIEPQAVAEALAVVHVPTVEEEDRMRLNRERERLVKGNRSNQSVYPCLAQI
jgi:hypothetical protein